MSEYRSSIRRIGVVVPARNEQQLLPACLAALDRAAAAVPLPVSVVLVLDACSDESAAVAAATAPYWLASLRVLSCDRRNVGHARDLGIRALLAEYGPDGLWLATSDADSVVPADWFGRQLRHRAAGAAAVLGTVQVSDWVGHSAELRRRYLQNYRFADGHRHTHGANLSLSAGAYLAAGGFPHLAADEDVALMNRLLAADQPIAWAADLPVLTSARLQGRSPAGFAHHLRLIASAPEPPSHQPAGAVQPATSRRPVAGHRRQHTEVAGCAPPEPAR